MRPPNPIHPGQVLRGEFLAPVSIPQQAFSKRLGWTVAKLDELIQGQRGVMADSALDPADELHTSPEVWLNLQMQFDLGRTKRGETASRERR